MSKRKFLNLCGYATGATVYVGHALHIFFLLTLIYLHTGIDSSTFGTIAHRIHVTMYSFMISDIPCYRIFI